MSYVKDDFRALAASVQEDIDNADMQNDFEPPKGFYNCLFQDMQTGAKTNENTGKNSVWVRLVWRILDGVYEGSEFSTIFSSAAAFAMGPYFALGRMLTSDPDIEALKDILGCTEAIAPFVGKATVEVSMKYQTAKGGRTYSKPGFTQILSVEA